MDLKQRKKGISHNKKMNKKFKNQESKSWEFFVIYKKNEIQKKSKLLKFIIFAFI